ncbi:MAG: hypothetical protein ACE5I7_00995 [Candidatus Binatia bacterium]
MRALPTRAVLAALAVLGTHGLAVAAESTPHSTVSLAADAVEVHIGAVLASNSGNEFDARLASLHRQFNTLFPYTSYRLVKEEHQRVPWGGRVGFDIPGGRYVLVIPKEYKNGRVSMKVMVVDGSRFIVDTALSLRSHATFLVGGPRQHGGVLILSIGADALP